MEKVLFDFHFLWGFCRTKSWWWSSPSWASSCGKVESCTYCQGRVSSNALYPSHLQACPSWYQIDHAHTNVMVVKSIIASRLELQSWAMTEYICFSVQHVESPLYLLHIGIGLCPSFIERERWEPKTVHQLIEQEIRSCLFVGLQDDVTTAHSHQARSHRTSTGLTHPRKALDLPRANQINQIRETILDEGTPHRPNCHCHAQRRTKICSINK